MKLFIPFAITLLFAATPQLIASSSLAAKDVQALPAENVSRLTPSQARALKQLLALDDATHAKVIARADPLKVAKFMEIYELFEKQNVTGTMTYKEETFDFAIAYVPCEIAWHLRILEFDEVIQCLEKSASWKVTTTVGDQVLVNFFADKHAFELIQLLKTTDVDDDDLFLSIQKMLSSERFFSSASTAFFLQHALALYKQDSTSLARREMAKSFLSLHLSAFATEFDNQKMLKAVYTELPHNLPTLFAGRLPGHAIAVVATRTNEDEYDIIIVNSGLGIENHESTTEIQPKGFHTGASYDDLSTGKPVEATSYNPLLRMKGITGTQLSSAHHYSGLMDQVYYVAKHASSHVVKEPLMPWEWTESQGIGTCAATSIWFALHFYYQALAYENDLRLSMLDQALGDLEELQNKAEGLERQMNADYQDAWEAFKEARKGKTGRFHYDQGRVKDLRLEKDKAEKSLHLRRAIISMALNEILRNIIVWHHELSDINADPLTKSKDEEILKTIKYSKTMQRCEVLEKAIPQTMVSFHSFWELQKKKYAERHRKTTGKKRALSSVLDSWLSIRADVRTMYNDAIRVTKIEPEFATVLAKKTFPTKRKFKPINVGSLDEHSALDQILRYIINFGDSPALRKAISEHIKAHTKNTNAAKYLIALYACLAKDVPLLDHLVVQLEWPLLYTISARKGDTDVSMYWDLKKEEDIAALAAHEFTQYGQPLDAFPELFRMSKKETKGIVDKFKDAYKRIAPTINAKTPSQDDVDEALQASVRHDAVAAVAYILRRAAKEAISDAFIETDNVKVLRLLADSIGDSKLITQKIETSIKKDNVEIVESLLPFYFRFEEQAIEKVIIGKQTAGSTVSSKPARISVPESWLDVAYNGNAVNAMAVLASLSNEGVHRRLFSAAIKDKKSEMTRVLAKYAASDEIFTAIEEARTSDRADLANALFEEYARKMPVITRLLEAVEDDKLDELGKLIPSVDSFTISLVLLVAAEKGKMECFGKLFPHSTHTSIHDAVLELSDENLKHPFAVKAISTSSAYKEVGKRAAKTSNAELMARMLPFMRASDLGDFFEIACKNEKSLDVTRQLFQFASSSSINECLEASVKKDLEDRVRLLLPRVYRKTLAEISLLPEFKEFNDAAQQAIRNRIDDFPAEVAIELAFLPEDNHTLRAFLESELGKDKTNLACKDQESCIKMIESMGSSALMFPIEQAIGRLLGRKEDNASLEKLLPFATPFACTRVMLFFSKHDSEKSVKACAEKALKADLIATALSAREKKNFELVESLVPFLSPLGIIELLEACYGEKIDAVRVNAMLADLPPSLADEALRIAVCGNKEEREKSIPYLLPEASPEAIGEVCLFSKRINFDDEQLNGALARAFEEYTHKKPVLALLLEAAEHNNFDAFSKLIPSANADTIDFVLFKAAEEGKMDCFEKLVPHSTKESIHAAILKLSDENLKHPSVLKAVANASSLSTFGEIIEKATSASNFKLIMHMLPFMDTIEIAHFLEAACKSAESFMTTKQLAPFTDGDSAGACLETAIEKEMEDLVRLLLPRVKRERLAEISRLPEFEKLDEDTQQAIRKRTNDFSAEVAVELAFLPKDQTEVRESLQAELDKYTAKLEEEHDSTSEEHATELGRDVNVELEERGSVGGERDNPDFEETVFEQEEVYIPPSEEEPVVAVEEGHASEEESVNVVEEEPITVYEEYVPIAEEVTTAVEEEPTTVYEEYVPPAEEEEYIPTVYEEEEHISTVEEYNPDLQMNKIKLACVSQDGCIQMATDRQRRDSSAFTFPVEQAIERLVWNKENNAALEMLLPLATPYACTRIMQAFSKHGSEKAVRACAEKALKTAVLSAARSAREENIKVMKFLVPFLSPLGIVKLLEPSEYYREILAVLPSGLADAALRIAVREDEKTRKETVRHLLPKASQAAIDDVYLFAKRAKFVDEQLKAAASYMAKAQGKKIEKAAK